MFHFLSSNDDNGSVRHVEVDEAVPSTSTTPESPAQDMPRVVHKRRRRSGATMTADGDRPCNAERTEEIDQALVKMIIINQLPLSFVSSAGFKQFMNVVERCYAIPREDVAKKRLRLIYDNVKAQVVSELAAATSVSWTSDCWSSRAHDSYITIVVHVLDSEWTPKSFTLTTEEMEERHTADNLAARMTSIMLEFSLENKVTAVVTDNLQSAVNAVKALENVEENIGLTCAAHSLQLAVSKALGLTQVQEVCEKASRIVRYFHQSNLASHALENMQKRLEMNTRKLIQSCRTRWNSTYEMLNRLLGNRNPTVNVLADRSIVPAATAHKLEFLECDWAAVESLVGLLKPLQVATTVLCGENGSPVSMVRPVINSLLEKHMAACDTDNELMTQFKCVVSEELKARFAMAWDPLTSVVSARQIASCLDPRYKDLQAENPLARHVIRNHVRNKVLNPSSNTDADTTSGETAEGSGLDFLFQEQPRAHTASSQFDLYLAESQIGHNQDAYLWWRSHEAKYPAVAALAKRYLSIPSTSASSERTFSTAGNIVSPKRNCLLPENVNMLVFLYQNRHLL